MVLETNQIRNLHIWVHPDYSSVSMTLFRQWSSFIEILASEPEHALIQTSLNPSCYDQRHPITRIEDEELRRPWDFTPRRKEFLVSLSRLEDLAADRLGERYFFWPYGGFVSGREKLHVDKIKERFNVKPVNSVFGVRKKPFVSSICYGLKPNACVARQAMDMYLERIADRRHNSGYSPLDNLAAHTKIPSCEASFDILARNGAISHDSLDSYRHRFIPKRI